MMDVLRFWFDRGVDGFRIDVLWHCLKSEDLRDNPPNPAYQPGMGEKYLVLQHNSTNQPEIHELAHAFRTLADLYGDRLLVGEIFLPLDQLMTYYGTAEQPGVHLPFNFQLLETPWQSQALAQAIGTYEAALPPGGWPNWVMGSHDAARIAGRLGEAQARNAAVLLLTLRGTPTLYQGDELGIGRIAIAPERIRDPQDLRQPGLGLGRDGARTPMAWDEGANAGFSAEEPWLPLHEDWRCRNVARQEGDAGSMLGLYRQLLKLRRQHLALSLGEIVLLPSALEVLRYERRAPGERLLVALNLGTQERHVDLPPGTRAGELLLSTTGSAKLLGNLAADEGIVVKLEEC